MGSIKGGGQQVAVVDYTMSMHYGVAISADSLTGIYASQKTVWEGDVTVNAVININNPSLFGGPKAQGGMVGQCFAMFGRPDQIAPLALAKRLLLAGVALTRETCPAFRGLLTLLFCSEPGAGFHFQYNSPNIPPLSFKLRRAPVAPALDPTYAYIPARGAAANRLVAAGFNDNLVDPETGLPITIIGTGPTYGPTIPDANPAHIIYELLTNPDWGMGLDPERIETSTFQAAATQLFVENLGLSIIWTSQGTIDALVTQILGTIQAALYTRPSTGRFELKLFRPDYWIVTTTGSVFSGAGDINQHNATITSFSRKLPGELANEVVVDWTNPLTEQTESITVQDPGSIANQNGIISQRSSYPGVRNEILAGELAMRDLRSIGAPLGVIEAQVNRELWDLVPGDVVTVTYPEYGLDGLICRIAKIDYGKPGDSVMKVNLLEDIFATGSPSYVTAPPPVWEDPKKDPQPATLVLPLTLPMYMLLNLGDSGVAAGREFAEVTVGMLAAPPVQSSNAFELVGETVDSLGNATDTDLGTKNFQAHGVSTTVLTRTAVTGSFVIGPLLGYGAVPIGAFVVMVSDVSQTDRTMEIMAVSSTNATLGTVTLERGLFDTIPRDWPIGTPFYLINQATRFDDPIGRAAGGIFDYKLLTIAAGMLNPALAPVVEFSPTQRPFLPNRPGNVRVAGSAFAAVDWASDDDIPVTWANRNRLAEESRIVLWGDADLPPESGQTTTIKVWSEVLTGAPITTIDGLAGTSHDVPLSAFDDATSGYIQVLAKRAGLESLQGLMIHVGLSGTSVDLTGYGYDYGNNYGGVGSGGGGGGGGDADDWIVIPNDTAITIGGLSWQTLNADTGHSLLYSPSLGVYRFEVLNGEHYTVGAPWDDPPETMRSEVYGPPFAFDAITTFRFTVKVLSGQEPTTNQWFDIGQIHVGAFVGTGGSPPVALDVRPDGSGGEKWQLDYNYQPIGTSTITYTNLGAMAGFLRDTDYVVELIYKDDHGGPNGYVKWTVNGVVIVNFTGVTGYSSSTSGSYPKFGIYTGGNGSTLDLPLPGQDIIVEYKDITFSAATVVADAFYMSPSGNDTTGNGTKALPYRTATKVASSITPTRRTVYLMPGTHNLSAMPIAANTRWEGDPADPPQSATIHATVSNLALVTSLNGITIRNLKFTSAANDGNTILGFFGGCEDLVLEDLDMRVTGWQQCIQVYNPGPGLENQGIYVEGPTIGPTGADGVFLYNLIVNNGANYDDPRGYKIRDLRSKGGTFPFQIQCQFVNGIWAYWNIDRIYAWGWGSPLSTVGNEGISLAGSANALNHDNSCFGHTLIQGGVGGTETVAGDLSPKRGGGVEATLAGCTYSGMTIKANFPISVALAPNSVFENNDLTTLTTGDMCFADDGGWTGDDVEIGDNIQNGSHVTGAGSPTNLSPLPSATGIPRYAHSAPYP